MIASLTYRERQICELMVSGGKSNREIAEFLGIALGTVKLHLETCRAKFGAKNRTDLAVKFITEKLSRTAYALSARRADVPRT